MLSLKIDDTNVDLPDDFSFTMNLKSPVFGDIGSYSYPFKLPNTPRNATLMGFRHRVENTGDVYETNQGMFLWNGLNLFQGTVKLKTLSSKNYEGYMTEGSGDFFYQKKSMSLQDIDFDLLTFASEPLKMDWINDCVEKYYPDRNIAFPMILNKTFFSEEPTDPALLYMNYYYYSSMLYFTQDGNRTIIVPMLYLRYVLKKLFEQLNYTFEDSFFSMHPDYNKLAIFNLVDANTTETGYFTYDKLHLYYNYHIPRMNLNDFISGLESFFNIRFFVNNVTKVIKIISVDSIVKSLDSIDFSKNVISLNTELEEEIIGFDLKMTMESDDEYWSAAKTSQDAILSYIKEPVQSLSDLNPWPASENMDIRYVKDVNTYYRLYNKVWVTSPFLSSIVGFSQFIYKFNSNTIESKTSSLFDETNFPRNCVIGNAMTSWNKIGLKLFFVDYDETQPYFKKVVGRNYTNEHYLFFFGETGLFNKHFKAYCDFRMETKLVKITRQMSFIELKDFDFSKKIMIGGTKYLVKNLQVTIKKDRIMPALLDCYTCN